jgi:predicted nucleic acid-binding protein
MSPLVIDASVAAKWVFPEVHSATARAALSMAELLAPDLLWAELGNIVWRRHRQGEFDVSVARGMLADLCSLEIRSFGMLV